jgi:hypothetical protein
MNKQTLDQKLLKKKLFDHLDSLLKDGAKGFVKFSVEECRRHLEMEDQINQRTFLRWYDEWCDKRFGDL